MLQRLVLALLLVICYPVYSTELTPPANPANDLALIDIRSSGTALNLGDDSVSGNIPLGWNFILFGKTFDSVWISNNGVISFSNNSISGYDGAPLNTLGSNYNYSLFPLWTDLINNGDSHSPFYRIDSNTAIFGWYNVSEYNDRSKRSTFEVQLWDTNAFQFRYDSVQVNSQPFTIGYTGDISAGEYTQWARHPGGPYSANNFGFYSDPINQCEINPLYSVNCPGYEAAYLNQQCSVNQLYSSSCPGYEQALLDQNCGSNPLYSVQCPGYASAILEQNCSKDALYSSQCPGYTVAMAQKITKSQEAELSVSSSPTTIQVEDPVIETKTDVGGVEMSATGEITVASGIPEVVKSSDKSTRVLPVGKGINPRLLDIVKNVLINESLLTTTLLDNINYSVLESLQFSKSTIDTNQSTEGMENNNSSMQFRQLAMNQTNTQLMTTDAIETVAVNTLNTTSQISDLGEGASFGDLAKVPNGFNAYTATQLRDAQFYPPKEIYKGQVTVDNASAQRLLNGASDRTHQRMIEQQYNLER